MTPDERSWPSSLMSSREGSITAVSPRVTHQVRRSGLGPNVNLTWPSGLTTWTSFMGTTRWLRRDFVWSCPRPRGCPASWAWHRPDRHSAATSAGTRHVLLDASILGAPWFLAVSSWGALSQGTE